jgi:hypothetical protein
MFTKLSTIAMVFGVMSNKGDVMVSSHIIPYSGVGVQ